MTSNSLRRSVRISLGKSVRHDSNLIENEVDKSTNLSKSKRDKNLSNVEAEKTKKNYSQSIAGDLTSQSQLILSHQSSPRKSYSGVSGDNISGSKNASGQQNISGLKNISGSQNVSGLKDASGQQNSSGFKTLSSFRNVSDLKNASSSQNSSFRQNT